MMKLLKNPEVRRDLAVFAIFAVLASAASFLVDIFFGFAVLGLSCMFILLHLLSVLRRYRRIAALSEDIDRILHGDESISIESYSEGELAILQSEIYKMTVRLREQQQLALSDRIHLADSLADISHQIRTPLTSINLLVSLISAPDITDARRMELLCELRELLSRIDWLITTLLKLSRLDAGMARFTSETTSMHELISAAVAPLLVPVELRGQSLSISAQGNFVGDRSWTAEAVGNIVKNCMEHSPAGGTICIDASETALYSQIVISDSGSGISPEDLPHIFERFYKGKSSGEKSFGICLALARTIISLQNGTIKAANRSPSGAEFTIRFYKGTV